jgi:hypothetical protein
MKNEKEYSHIAVQILRAALITGDERAISQVLQQHFPLFSLPEEQLLVELQGVMAAYFTLLSHLDIFAPAQRPEFFGLRELIKQVQEKRLQDERQATSHMRRQ